MSYVIVWIDEVEYVCVDWVGFIFDEVQFVKNLVMKFYCVVVFFCLDVMFVVIGMLMENSFSEFWVLLKFIVLGFFVFVWKFCEQYIQLIEQGKVFENEEGGVYWQQCFEQLCWCICLLFLWWMKEIVVFDFLVKQEQIFEVEFSFVY